MADKQLSFAERIALMRETASVLRTASETVALEAERMAAAEQDAQRTGMSVVHGHVGYLREAYHGGPYVTRFLMPEAFEAPFEEGAPLPAATLRQRLPAAVLIRLYREHKIYGAGKDPGRVQPSELESALRAITGVHMRDTTHEGLADALSPESTAHAARLIAGRALPDTALAFVDFVELCERKERETGEPCRIAASF